MKKIICAIFVLGLLGCNTGSPRVESDGINVDTVSAWDMYQEYTANEISADSRYSKKWIVIKGVVGTIAKTDDGKETYLTIVGGGGNDHNEVLAQCFLTEEAIKQVSSINGRTAIAIKGYNVGKKVIKTNESKLRLNYMALHECSIVLISNDITF